jgi:CRP-like cAMP-binding protein
MSVPGLFYNAQTFKDAPAGTVIFEEGSSGTEMFGVVEGEVEVRLPNGATRRLGPDDTFGEMAIIDSFPPKRDSCRSGRHQAGGDRPGQVPLPGPGDADVRAASDVEYGQAPSRR